MNVQGIFSAEFVLTSSFSTSEDRNNNNEGMQSEACSETASCSAAQSFCTGSAARPACVTQITMKT
jgi:hypothetical protein